MAEVFQAKDTRNGAEVAVKRILPNAAEDDDFLAMFQDEARIVSTLEHPHIARCLDYGQVGGSWYIAFEYVDGRDLRAVIDRAAHGGERPPMSVALYVISRIGEGLAYAHARKMANGAPVELIHRDVSPQNIVISFDGDVKLIDFGIAKAAGRLVRTRSGTIKGKLGYMSPEQVRGQPIDQRTDVFSLGICAWELLTLTRLFYAESEIKTIDMIREGQVRKPSAVVPSIPAELDRIILKALANKPDERYRSARDFYKDVNAAAGSFALLAEREQVAAYMRRAFSQVQDVGSSRAVTRGQETGSMSADKQGSDLDVFEGLGKKTAKPQSPPTVSSGPSATASNAVGPTVPGARTKPSPSVPPPPPPAVAPRGGGELAKKTLMGMPPAGALPQPGPLPPATSTRTQPPSPPGRTQPPPPPGRAILPQVSAPPPKGTAGSIAPPKLPKGDSVPPPPVAPTKPPPANTSAVTVPQAAKAPQVDLDWNDDDEATQIFDKEDQAAVSNSVRSPGPAAGTPPPPAQMSPAAGGGAKATLMGMNMPLPSAPPPKVTKTMPPPAVGAVPPPAQTNTAFPPLPQEAPPPAPPPQPVPPEYAQQVHTVPMPMPGSQTGSRPPPAGFPPAPAFPPPSNDMGYPPPPGIPSRMETTAVVHPAPRKPWVTILAAALAAAIVGGGALYVVNNSKPARLTIKAADSKGLTIDRAEVSIDGKTRCDTVPCIAELPQGKHLIRVAAPGFDKPILEEVELTPGSDIAKTFAFAETVAKPTGLKVAGNQPGVHLFIDGKDMGSLPQEVKDLTPGEHQMRLSGVAGDDRFAPIEQIVSIGKDDVKDLGAMTLKVKKGTASISIETPGAKAFLVSATERRVLDKNPITVAIDAATAWSIEATKSGFVDYKQPISFDDGQAEKTFTVTLEPKSAAAAPAAYTAPTPKPRAEPRAEAPTAPAAAEQGEAFLNINSIPPSTCYLDGKAIGNTPKKHFSVKPGTHSVKFVNSELSLQKTISVSVTSGDTQNAVAHLQ